MENVITDCGAKALLWEIFNRTFSELVGKWKYLESVRHSQQDKSITISTDDKEDLRNKLIEYIRVNTHKQVLEYWGQRYIDNIYAYKDIKKMREGYDLVCHYIMWNIGAEPKPSEKDCAIAEEIIKESQNKQAANPYFYFPYSVDKKRKEEETLDIAVSDDYNDYINGVNNLNDTYGF